MSDRITMSMLNASLNYINRLTEIEHTIEGANGGWKLCRGNGSVNVFHLGYISKRELYDMMQAYARGFELSNYDRNLLIKGGYNMGNFYVCRQMNSGGGYTQPGLNIVVEADTVEEAQEYMSEGGISNASSCECCGDRWDILGWYHSYEKEEPHYKDTTFLQIKTEIENKQDRKEEKDWGGHVIPLIYMYKKFPKGMVDQDILGNGRWYKYYG